MDNIDGSYQQWLLYLQNYDDECDIYWNQRKYLYKTSGYIDPYLDNKVFYDGQFWESTKDYHNAYLDNKTSNDRHFVDNTTGYDGMYLINTAWNNEVHPCNITAYCTDCCHNHLAFYEDLMNNDEPNRETANYTRDLWPPLSVCCYCLKPISRKTKNNSLLLFLDFLNTILAKSKYIFDLFHWEII